MGVLPGDPGSGRSDPGVLALLLPFRDGAFPAAMRKQAKKGVAVVEPRDHDRALVGMTSGPGLAARWYIGTMVP